MSELTELSEEQQNLLAKSNELKAEGNIFLGENKFALAAEKYSDAISIFPTAILYSNRAQALIKLESFGLAISDANQAIELDPGYIKAYYRRANANLSLMRYEDALSDFKTVCKIVPSDADAKKKLKACQKAIKDEAFRRAIELDEAEEAKEQDFNHIEVESSYSGPHLEEGVVTMDFVMELMAHFKAQQGLHRKYMMQMLVAAKNLFSSYPSLIRIPIPENEEGEKTHVTVCGDTHGQFYDLCNIFELGGLPSPSNPYLFNGDYVDRGSFSLETVTLLLAIKLACPSALHMLRGNHETKNMNKIYGFEGEVRHKYQGHSEEQIVRMFTEVFNWLPLSAVVGEGVFVVHGGLSTEREGRISLSEIAALLRGREPPESGLGSDLLWADPHGSRGRLPSKRGIGFSFGPNFTDNFLAHNGLRLVVRSHEVRDNGYSEEHGGKCITVFSAPNYCDQMGNKGAFIRFGPDLVPQFTTFTAVPHPNVPPMRYASNMFGF